MRLRIRGLQQRVKRDLPIEFRTHALTSYGGLELLRRYVRRLALLAQLCAALADLGGDYGAARLARLVLALIYVGARRPEHLRYLNGDSLVLRFCGLHRLPTARTLTGWLRQFTQARLAPLIALNVALVLDTLVRLRLPRLTLDVDGTVVRTGATVAWAFRGFNPHHRKDLSYYPLTAHVAETGHLLRVKNRPGNVHDSKQAVAFLREVLDTTRARLGPRVRRSPSRCGRSARVPAWRSSRERRSASSSSGICRRPWRGARRLLAAPRVGPVRHGAAALDARAPGGGRAWHEGLPRRGRRRRWP